ncbi:MAG: hypothetical protein D6737_05345 [Chloroflexi bacterium]|nr:MAG: hypothetical protein D6737_05345 [Chloroflexota bacterium]
MLSLHVRYGFGLLVLVAALAGCNLSSQNVIFVTATPLPQQGTPLPTAPPTAPPTPTQPPDVLLQQADRDVVNGFRDAAIERYRSVLTQDATPQQRATAAFSLGQVTVREGLFQEAHDTLTGFINEFPQEERIPQAYFLRGDANLGLARWNEAIADFRQYLALRPGLIDSYVHERIADAQLALGQRTDALASYTLATQAQRPLVPSLILREKIARIHLAAQEYAQAVSQYDTILAVARNAPYRASIDFEAAQALLQSGDTQGGLARLQMIFEDYGDTATAYQAMLQLEANGVPISNLEKGRTAFVFGDYQMAIDAFNTYTTQQPIGAIPPDLYLLLGRAYREIGNPAAALTAFQTIIDTFPQSPEFGAALLEQGRTHFLNGDIPAAISQYERIANNFGYLPEAAEALWRAGFLYGTNGEPALSRAVFERLATEFPNTEQARSGLFLAAASAFNSGDSTGAETLYARLATMTTGEEQAAAYWWVGRLAQLRGDTRTATDAFRLATETAPDSYFSARAQDIVNGLAPFSSPAAFRFNFDENAERAAAEQWLRTTFGIVQEGALTPLAPALQADPHLIRGRELWAVADFQAAEEEFFTLVEMHKTDGLASYQLAVFFRDIGAFQPSIFAAANVINAANVGTLAAPPYIARMRYPIYYADVVLPIAERRGIDPLLIFSLIRTESLFDADATAAAGERGLMQVIPSTAAYIAEQIQWPDYQPTDLFQPQAAVEFGTFYLWEQLNRFDNNVMAALAGYNAGPGRAIDWLALSGGDPDAFMTAITIDSTRQYVQRIYSFYNIYRVLYGHA